MNSFRQLYRHPLKSILGLALLTLSAALLCIAAGQYIASLRTRAHVENSYTTVALPTDAYMTQDIVDETGTFIGKVVLSSQPVEIEMWINSLPELYPDLVQGQIQQRLASAFALELTPLNITAHQRSAGPYSPLDGAAPYSRAVLEVTLTEIGTPYENTAGASYGFATFDPVGICVDLIGTIDAAIALEAGFTDPVNRTLRFTLTVPDLAALEAMDLQEGARYLVYGTQYEDEEWMLRSLLMSLSPAGPVYEPSIDPDRLQAYVPNSEQPNTVLVASGETPVAVYQGWLSSGEKAYVQLTQQELDMIACSSMRVLDPSALPQCGSIYGWDEQLDLTSTRIRQLSDGSLEEISLEDYQALYQTPTMVQLEGSAEEFLSSEDGALWRKAIDEMEICNHALPVLGTPKLEAMIQFAKQETNVTAGRTFTVQEYAQGSRVCILSESLAAANGLAVGDVISLQFYSSDNNLLGQDRFSSVDVVPAFYSSALGFAGEPEDFTIVGLYRQSQEWVGDATSFLPNTVFVPEKALTCETRTANCGVFSTLVLQNGAIDQVQSLAAEAGYEDLFVYFDQGYSAIGGSLDAYDEVARLILPVGVVAWAGILALFLVLFPARQRRDLARMLSIGAEPREARRHLLASSLGLAIPAAILGAVISSILQNSVAEKMMEAAELENPLELIQSPWVAPILAVVQIALYGLVFYLFSLLTSHKLRGLMGEKAK